ncbi:uncharacterized protein LOC144821831 [Lissotriton helveticus]
MAVLSGLLLCILFFSSSGRGKKIDIIQTPEVVNASVGSSVTLTCSWEISEGVEKIRVQWLKRTLSDSSPLDSNRKESELSLDLFNLTGNMEKCTDPSGLVLMMTSYKCDNKTCQTMLHLSSLKMGDTGFYWCKITVELPPPFVKHTGKGTSLTVKEIENDEQKHYNKLAILLIFLLGIPVCFYCKRMQKPRIKARRITEETQLEEIELHEFHLEGNDERRGTDSSSSSAEWMASTCYESVDYFAMKPNDNKGGACPE